MMLTALAQIGIVLTWLGLVGGAAEGVRRFTSANPEITRKIVHIGAGQVILLAWWLQTPAWMGITASVLFSIVALLSYRYPILPGINGVGRHSLGTFFYATSIGLLTAAFWPMDLPQYAALGILVMTWGDGLAALVGQNFGRHPYKILGSTKSWEGSLTMLVMSFTVSLLILGWTAGLTMPVFITATLVALAATLLETLSFYGLDNLTVPLGSAVLAYGLLTML
ncbi:diacylglycerol/polyprenol kinase family protein [Phormidium sp. FACHB-1136]|uniref:diacylglycerol/polyprenol kinase family protein n=1 Tax=Phormidium sp. FACHB-1136 TaxID=2692848 RepID=UPI001689EBD3|nr:diacylglycerol/polyprenol kinase family protein [Phormidium sp. FACHB-1136]MBD2424589.1 phosphatidate cytidylyltransferase [Phormidium sp. FACHB-1136]